MSNLKESVGHLANHIQNPQLRSDNTLHVVGVITNSVRYQSRYRLAREWIERMKATPNVRLYLVEAAYGDRCFEVTDAGNRDHLQLRMHSEIWLKENLINLGVKHLFPRDWRYMAFVDMDISFLDPGWALGAIHQLQHYPVIQPWQDCLDMDFHGGVHQHFKSFGSLHAKGKPKHHGKGHPSYDYAHTGFAWCMTRYFYENVGGLLDFCVFGSGDHHMAWAMVGMIESTIHQKVNDDYKRLCREWQEKAVRAGAQNVGYLHGTIHHHHHGPKKARGYWSRWDIPIRHDYTPSKDLWRDSQGLLVLKDKPAMEQDMMKYNRSRMEDSIEQY